MGKFEDLKVKYQDKFLFDDRLFYPKDKFSYISSTDVKNFVEFVVHFNEYSKSKEKNFFASSLFSRVKITSENTDKLIGFLVLLSDRYLLVQQRIYIYENEELKTIEFDTSNEYAFHDKKFEIYLTALSNIYNLIRNLPQEKQSKKFLPYFGIVFLGKAHFDQFCKPRSPNIGGASRAVHFSSALQRSADGGSQSSLGNSVQGAVGGARRIPTTSQLNSKIRDVIKKHDLKLKDLYTKLKDLQNLNLPKNILICCTANHTRSPVVESVLQAILQNGLPATCRVNVESAGVGYIRAGNRVAASKLKIRGNINGLANCNSIKVLNELQANARFYNTKNFDNLSAKINKHILRDVNDAYQNIKNWDLVIFMEEKHKPIFEHWKDVEPHPNKISKQRLRCFHDAKFILKNRGFIKEFPKGQNILSLSKPIKNVYDPQGDFDFDNPKDSYDKFIELLDETIDGCIDWVTVMHENLWKTSLKG